MVAGLAVGAEVGGLAGEAVADIAGHAGQVKEGEALVALGADVIAGTGLAVRHCAGERRTCAVLEFVVGEAFTADVGLSASLTKLDRAGHASPILNHLVHIVANDAEVGLIAFLTVADIALGACPVGHQDEPGLAFGANGGVLGTRICLAVDVDAGEDAGVVDELTPCRAGGTNLVSQAENAAVNGAVEAFVGLGVVGVGVDATRADVVGRTSRTVSIIASYTGPVLKS